MHVTASFCTCIGSGYTENGGRNYVLMAQVAKVINCIVSGSGIGINSYDSTYNLVQVSDAPWISWSSTNFVNGSAAARSANTGEITGDPLFVSGSDIGQDPLGGSPPKSDGNVHFASQEYSLQSGSPAINAGADYLDITTDISGNTRDSDPDIGAYEFAIAGYANKIINVVAGSLGKILDISKANVSKVVGT
jgi:hypothetical protein